ncbi:exosome complex component RRP41 [Parasteatoda tepidariorum]|uniref:exosome complex component RRP41 n=1 Tax=Parasteatoda tepidariorum TaxID=114398 RepID=UPI00077F9DD7|nr:exosome complex component RRP41 [Parasteatoda tepidariorum]
MAGLELLADQGIRMDGRRPGELRKIDCKLGVSTSADGSAFFQQGNTKVLATVYGPHEVTVRKGKAATDHAIINCQYRTAPFSTSTRNKVSRNDRRCLEMSIILRQAFEAAVLTSTYPGSQIDIFFLVLYSDGGNLSACINAGTLALINAAIPLKDYLCACCSGFVNETPLKDINHYESILGGTELNLAMLRKSEMIVCDELTARIHRDHLGKIRKMAMQGCHDISAILDAAIKKHLALVKIT